MRTFINFAFSACAATTYGRLDSHLLRLLYIAAKKRAELLHVYHRPLTNVDHLFGISFAQSRARIGAAVAKGMALRALGTSAMGVSKVFLRHIAPALYRDQDLASQRRALISRRGMRSGAMPTPLSTCVCSSYIC